MNVNYDGKVFRGRSNTPNGEVDGSTLFHYHQADGVLTGTYSGGSVVTGQLLGHVHTDGRLEFHYHHLNTAGALMAGKCRSVPREENGRLVLQERWQWLTGDQSSGESEVEEVLER